MASMYVAAKSRSSTKARRIQSLSTSSWNIFLAWISSLSFTSFSMISWTRLSLRSRNKIEGEILVGLVASSVGEFRHSRTATFIELSKNFSCWLSKQFESACWACARPRLWTCALLQRKELLPANYFSKAIQKYLKQEKELNYKTGRAFLNFTCETLYVLGFNMFNMLWSKILWHRI